MKKVRRFGVKKEVLTMKTMNKKEILKVLIEERSKYMDFNRKNPAKEYYGLQKAIDIIRKMED